MRIEGEKILCIFKKMSGPYVIAGTGRHREQRAIIEGLPAVCIVTLERNGDVEGSAKKPFFQKESFTKEKLKIIL